MKDPIFVKENEADRLRYLEEGCEVKEKYPVRIPYDQAEVTNFKSKQSQVAIIILDTDKEKKEVAGTYTTKLKALKEDQNFLLEKIRNGYEDVTQDVFGMPDYDNLNIDFFDVSGKWVYTRQMNPEERQTEMTPLLTDQKKLGNGN